MREQNNTYPSIGQTLFLLILLFVLTVVIGIVNRVFLYGTVNNSLLDLLRTLIADSIILAIAYLLRKRGDKQFSIPLRPINSNIFLWVTFISPFCFFFISGIVIFICMLFPYFITNPPPNNISIDTFTLIKVACIVPIFEELIFRGIILDGFLHRYSPFKAIFLSSLCFASLHFGPQIATSIFLGLMAGYLYYYTKSVWPGIILHGLNNFYACFIVYVTDEAAQSDTSDPIQSIKELVSTINVWWWINTILLLFILYYLLKKLKKDKLTFYKNERERYNISTF